MKHLISINERFHLEILDDVYGAWLFIFDGGSYMMEPLNFKNEIMAEKWGRNYIDGWIISEQKRQQEEIIK